MDDFLAKSCQEVELKARIASLLKVKAANEKERQYRRDLELEVRRRTRQLEDALAKQRQQRRRVHHERGEGVSEGKHQG